MFALSNVRITTSASSRLIRERDLKVSPLLTFPSPRVAQNHGLPATICASRKPQRGIRLLASFSLNYLRRAEKLV
jgi:hypothetical protein